MKVEPGYLGRAQEAEFASQTFLKEAKAALVGGCSLLPVSPDGHPLVDTISGPGDDVVELVGHAPGAGHVGHAARSVQLGCQDVVQHAPSVAYLKAAWFDPTNLHEPRGR